MRTVPITTMTTTTTQIEPIVLYDELYVAKQKRGNIYIGFIVPNGTDKATLKKIATANKWAGVNNEPEVFKNELLEGYEISRAVRRTYWGGGNVVWDIKDPRGFHFEITSNNMFKLLESATIVEGRIQGKCILGTLGGKHVLLPENSQPYQDSLKYKEHMAKPNVKVSTLSPGNIIKLKTQEVCEYIGSFHSINVNCEYVRIGNTSEQDYILEPSTTLKHLIKYCSTNTYGFVSSLSVADVIDDKKTTYSMKQVNKMLTSTNSRFYFDDDGGFNLCNMRWWDGRKMPLFAIKSKCKSLVATLTKKHNKTTTSISKIDKGFIFHGDVVTIVVDGKITYTYTWGDKHESIDYGT